MSYNHILTALEDALESKTRCIAELDCAIAQIRDERETDIELIDRLTRLVDINEKNLIAIEDMLNGYLERDVLTIDVKAVLGVLQGAREGQMK